MKDKATIEEKQYAEDHYYGKYSYSVDPVKYPPSIRIIDYVNHIPQIIEQIEP